MENTSSYVSLKHQVLLYASDSIKPNMKYDLESQIVRCTVKEINTNNGFFTDNGYMARIFQRIQDIRFSGAGTAHHNYLDERAIKTIV